MNKEQEIQRNELEKIIRYATSEKSRVEGKFRNIATINSLLIGTLTAIGIFVIRDGTSNAHYGVLGLIGFFVLLQLVSINICVYGIWPKESFIHSPYDIEYISHKKNVKNKLASVNNIEGYRKMIIMNAKSVVKKRKLARLALMFTTFPVSIFTNIKVKRMEEKSRKSFTKREQKYFLSIEEIEQVQKTREEKEATTKETLLKKAKETKKKESAKK